jgi:hypothetical protein
MDRAACLLAAFSLTCSTVRLKSITCLEYDGSCLSNQRKKITYLVLGFRDPGFASYYHQQKPDQSDP